MMPKNMFKDPVHFEKPKEAIPAEIAQRFSDGTLAQDAPVAKIIGKSKVFRCFERNEDVAGIERAVLRIDYRVLPESIPGRRNEVRFSYVQKEAQDSDLVVPVAEMFLDCVDDEHMELAHRYVEPAFRERKGIGSALLQEAEAWVAQVARQKGHDIAITLGAGQPQLIDWIQKRGYVVAEDQASLLAEVKEHPDRFQLDSAVQRSDLVKEQYLFRKEIMGRKREDAIRLKFSKVIHAV